MTKTALIADDDSSMRSMFSRLLRPLGWNVVEVADGCSALDKLSAHPIDLVILDQRMPQLTGVEVLSLMRGSPKHATIPVMVVTGISDAETSEAMLQLGVADYLVKPMRPEFVRDRLARIDRMISTTTAERKARRQEAPTHGSVVVVVDSEAENRAAIKTALTSRYEVVEMPSGVAALRACTVSPPALFIIGSDVGLMTPEFLTRKLRDRRDLAGTRILLVTPAPAGVKSGLFDGVLTKTLDPQAVSEQFDRIFISADERGGAVSIDARRRVDTAVAEVLETTTRHAVTMTPANNAESRIDLMQGSVDLQLETERLRVRVRCTGDHARAMAATALGLDISDVTAEAGLAAVDGLTQAIADKVVNALVAEGRVASSEQPETAEDGGIDERSPNDVILEFRTEGGAFTVHVVLQALRSTI